MSSQPIIITEPFHDSLSLEESQVMYDKFFHVNLHEFFLNEKNKIVLEKIHEDLHYVFNLFKTSLNFHVEFDFFWMGKSLVDFISGKSESINSLDIGITFNDSFTNYQYNKFSCLNELTQYLFELYNIPFHKILEKDLTQNEFYPYFCELIDFKGINFPIKLFPSLKSDKTVIMHYPFNILKVKLKLFNNKSICESILFPENLHSYYSRLEYNENFISSFLSQQVIYKNSALSPIHISHDFTEYLIPLLLSYPELTVSLVEPDNQNAEYIQNSLKKISSYIKLNQQLNCKLQPVNKKNKI